MRKAILFFVLFIIFIAFAVFLTNAFVLQKNYFENKNGNSQAETGPDLKEDYERAINEKRVLVLYFTSNWCQKCIDQENVNKQVFDELVSEGVVGLKIHILDSETTIETDALSQKFDVTKEQSFVILDKNGVVYFKYTGILEKDLLKQKILEAR
ncbi:hypothetical protein A2130_00160 [Candidatus Woesebacteria bacterium GWC2_33_12]|uniref:Thioredoxin domain-containing protein n=1 Tax=Candidatus Woesebacteria bacterium GW2011_GWB1_33_22 TaxID=1618566 RepID=A0A0F9ZKQ1_9BACT|nr:MAG: hypothetical protein UR29_C0010G0022 [Candidatus Woesebacteria bacterium GW2011_GWC2_33_12]KKP42047.1 MAG: hypothetical protein UR33_C0006G0031 [Candidatus Woesebacteria bacterium GW2011_GWA2_33_20]KKP44803.1 MAG: hypothetical protein UR35_C0006G0038 [Candidatus Woesebacteria bacterium GW2011_GWB1_33_22]KKP46622.1 MAG: hypothetical protein UR37_C0006G0072 [Microgenomates group bacterium GW2011_GWC1_33_28]KKP50535.1 MAG: hypothetical protein UR41_C0006G0038 [Candidatus Woesebacteria bact